MWREVLLCLCLLGSSSPLHAADTGTEMANLMRGMFTGLSLLGQAANTPGWNSLATPGAPGWPPGTAPWGGYPGAATPWAQPPWGSAGWPPTANVSPGYSQPGPTGGRYSYLLRLLQGEWETHNGGLLLVKGNLARLYVSRDRHHNLEITVDPHYLWMKPAGSTQAPDRYEHRIFDRRIILRDEAGKVLLLRRHVADE